MPGKPDPKDTDTMNAEEAIVGLPSSTYDEDDLETYELNQEISYPIEPTHDSADPYAQMQAALWKLITTYYLELHTIDCDSDLDESDGSHPLDDHFELAFWEMEQPRSAAEMNRQENSPLRLTRSESIAWTHMPNATGAIGEENGHYYAEPASMTWGIAAAPCYFADELEETGSDDPDFDFDFDSEAICLVDSLSN